MTKIDMLASSYDEAVKTARETYMGIYDELKNSLEEWALTIEQYESEEDQARWVFMDNMRLLREWVFKYS